MCDCLNLKIKECEVYCFFVLVMFVEDVVDWFVLFFISFYMLFMIEIVVYCCVVSEVIGFDCLKSLLLEFLVIIYVDYIVWL